MTKPTIGRVVIYTSKINNGPGREVRSPAIIIRTRDTTVPEVLERWGPEPTEVSSPPNVHVTAPRPDDLVAELPDDETVDLVVFGLGKTYREYAVRRGDGLGEWQWPERV